MSRTSSCRLPPSTFTPLTNYSSVCTTLSYCFPPNSKLISNQIQFNPSLSTNITRTEIEDVIELLYYFGSQPIEGNHQGNILGYGNLANAVRASNWIYKLSGESRLIDIMVRFSDNALAIRNSNTTGSTLWNGKKELVWPTIEEYAGSENGIFVSNMVNTAVEILKTPCLHDLVPPVFNGYPTPFPTGTTYLQKALNYIQAGEETYDTYLLALFVQSKTNLLIQPNDSRWNNDLNPAGGKAGTSMAWNRRMMMLEGLIKLNDAHDLLNLNETIDLDRVKTYDTIIQANILDFIQYLKPTISSSNNNKSTYEWSYISTDSSQIEEASQGIHGWFDMLGLFLAWQRDPIVFGITDEIMTTFANTMQYTINLGSNTFSGLVNGQSTVDNPSNNNLVGVWGLYSKWLPEWYSTLTNASTAVGGYGVTNLELLWVKRGLQLNETNYWRSELGGLEGRNSTISPRPQPIKSNSNEGKDKFVLPVILTIVLLALVVSIILGCNWYCKRRRGGLMRNGSRREREKVRGKYVETGLEEERFRERNSFSIK